jgi:zinc transport system permease protein
MHALDFFRDMAVNPFLGRGLLAGLLAAVACGVIGPYAVTRRVVFLAGAIAHIAVGGIGAAIFLRHHHPDTFAYIEPIHGAMVAALLAAVALAWIQHRAADSADTLIGALWSIGMATGVVLVKLTPGYQTELMSYLFGNIAFVSKGSLWLLAVLDVVIVATVLLFHKRFLAICLDAEQAALQRVGVLATQTVLLVLVALTVVALTQVVGLILVIALLSLPAATAGHLVGRLSTMIYLAVAANVLLTTLPRIAVYGTAISPEAAIVLAAGFLYITVLVLKRLRA